MTIWNLAPKKKTERAGAFEGALVKLRPLPASKNSNPTDHIRNSWDCFLWAIEGREAFAVDAEEANPVDESVRELIEQGLKEVKRFYVFNPQDRRAMKTPALAIRTLVRQARHFAGAYASGEATSAAARAFESSGYLTAMVDEVEARLYLDQSLKLLPSNADAGRITAYLCRRHGRPDAADEVFERVLNALRAKRDGIELREKDWSALCVWRDSEVPAIDKIIGLVEGDMNKGLS